MEQRGGHRKKIAGTVVISGITLKLNVLVDVCVLGSSVVYSAGALIQWPWPMGSIPIRGQCIFHSLIFIANLGVLWVFRSRRRVLFAMWQFVDCIQGTITLQHKLLQHHCNSSKKDRSTVDVTGNLLESGAREETRSFRDVKDVSRPGIEPGSQELVSCAITATPPQHDTTGLRHRAFDVFL